MPDLPATAQMLPTLSSSIQVLLLLSALTVLPAAVLMMTSFTRIVVVLAVLRQALGLGQSPPNQLLVGLALLAMVDVEKGRREARAAEAESGVPAAQPAL